MNNFGYFLGIALLLLSLGGVVNAQDQITTIGGIPVTYFSDHCPEYALGCFHPRENIIWLKTGMSYENQVYTAIHEYGHWIYFNKLSDSQLREWDSVSQLPCYVSTYASSNVLEDFAETYANRDVIHQDFNCRYKIEFILNI